MARIAIYGAGGLGRDLLPQLLRNLAPFDELILIDRDNAGGNLCGYPILGLDDLREGDRFVVASGSGRHREAMEKHCTDRGAVPHSFFAQTSCAGLGNEIAPGALFCDFSAVGSAVRIGRQFQCNIYSHVSHDCVIGDYVTFAPRVTCNGHVRIEDYATIGSGAIIIDGTADAPIVIGRGAMVGMGAVVFRSVPAGATVIGSPARAIKLQESL